MVISDLSQLAVAAEISDSDIEKIAVGMEAIVDINAHGPFKGKVERLPVEKANNNNNNYYLNPWNPGGNQHKRIDRRLYDRRAWTISLKGSARHAAQRIKSLRTARKMLSVIPPAALRTLSGRNYVQVVEEDGTKREVDVEVGHQICNPGGDY